MAGGIFMIIDFGVKNFLSFYDEINFSMQASKGTRLREHVVINEKYNLLKSSFIFGANASGKTNFIKCFAFFKDLVLNGFENSRIERKFFRLSKESYKENADFHISFVKNNNVFRYEISFSYFERLIMKEKLVLKKNNKDIILFERNCVDNKIYIYTDYKFKNQEDKLRFDIYVSDFEKGENPSLKQTFFLSDIAKRSSVNSVFFKYFIDVISWFKKVLIIFPNTKIGNINQLIDSNSEKLDLFKNLLKKLDTGITDISNKNLEFDELFKDLSEEESKLIKDKILNDLNEHPIMLRIDNAMVSLSKNENGVICVSQMQLNHGNDSELFDLFDESDGTRRLFDLLPLILSLTDDTIVLIDEIDRSLHTKLVRKLIQLYFENNSINKSQLIVTSHDVNLLDLDLLRQDEIWFISKENVGSKLFSLKDFNVRFDKKILKEYLDGMFGGIPKI